MTRKGRDSSGKTDSSARRDLVDRPRHGAKTRPVLILSVAYKDEERALVSYVVRTTSTRGTEYEVPHQAPKFLPGAFDVQSIGTVPDVQLIRRLTVCDAATLEKVEAALKVWLGL